MSAFTVSAIAAAAPSHASRAGRPPACALRARLLCPPDGLQPRPERSLQPAWHRTSVSRKPPRFAHAVGLGLWTGRCRPEVAARRSARWEARRCGGLNSITDSVEVVPSFEPFQAVDPRFVSNDHQVVPRRGALSSVGRVSITGSRSAGEAVVHRWRHRRFSNSSVPVADHAARPHSGASANRLCRRTVRRPSPSRCRPSRR
jgi:hypothetical protein